MDNLEECLLVLYNNMIIDQINDTNIWSAFFELAIQLDMQIHSDLCEFLQQEIVDIIIHKSQKNQHYQSIYLILLSQTCRLQSVFQYVIDRLLQNSRGFLKDEIFYANFSENIMNIWSIALSLNPKNPRCCHCISNISASFFRLLSTFFYNSENFSGEQLSDHGVDMEEEEEKFWTNLVQYQNDNKHSKNGQELENLFHFLHSCFLYYKTPAHNLNVCFCHCHKSRWISTYADTIDREDWRFTFIQELHKLEKLVQSTNVNNNNSRHLRFDFIDKNDNKSQSFKNSIEQVVAPKIEQETIKIQDDHFSNSDTTSAEWSIRNSDKYLLVGEKNNNGIKDIVIDKILQKNDFNKEDLFEKDEISSGHGKTESSIESIPFDEPEPIRSSVQQKNHLVDSTFIQKPAPLNIRLLKFEFDDDFEETENGFDENEKRHSIISDNNYSGFQTGFYLNDPHSSKIIDQNSNYEKPVDSISQKMSSKKDDFDFAVYIDKAVSSRGISFQSTFVQTDEIDGDSIITEENSKTEILLEDMGVGTDDLEISVKLLEQQDQSTQTISAIKKNIISNSKKNQFLYVENMSTVEIQNVCKLAQTFSTIC